MPDNGAMRLSAKADYAVRAAVELAAVEGQGPRKAERIADAQSIPIKFLETILLELKHAGIVRSQRGPDGGYTLARPAASISIADVIRAVDGPLANVRGDRPENIVYAGAAAKLTDLWIAVRAALSASVSAALAEVGAREALIALAVNESADLPEFSMRRMLERFGHDGEMREALLERGGLPASMRAELVAATARALSAFVTGRDWLSEERATRLAREAAEKATVIIAADVADADRKSTRLNSSH